MNKRIGILGAGVAGLWAAKLLDKEGYDVEVLEASEQHGGLARSFEWHGFDCDIAPHRLFPDSEETLRAFEELVPIFRQRRFSSIFINGKQIADPVNAIEIMIKFFPGSIRLGWDYFAAKFTANRPDTSFEDLVVNQFGEGLNSFFFKPYSEKLFGIPATEISPAWGRRKIRVGGLKDMLRRNSKLYFKEFYYPEKGGYGAIVDSLYAQVSSKVRKNCRVVELATTTGKEGYTVDVVESGEAKRLEYDVIVSSLPLNLSARMLGKELDLSFRPAKIVYLLLNRPRFTKNHWFYFADNTHIINRVAEFKNFNDRSAPKDTTVLCCEVTQTKNYSRARIIEELNDVSPISESDVLEFLEVDIPWAYPIYDLEYESQVQEARDFFDNHPRIFHIGRHAQFSHRDVDEIYEEAVRICAEVTVAFQNGFHRTDRLLID